MTKEAKMQIVIDNYFKSECDVNTSIRKAFEKGFRIGVQKGSVDAEPVKHGHWRTVTLPSYMFEGYRCSECAELVYGRTKYCPQCGAKMDGERKE